MAHPGMGNPTLVVVTDRNDLDNQLFGVFANATEMLRETPVRADTRPALRQLLANRPSGGIIFTTIQKFTRRGRGPVLSDRRNIVVICDEAHRKFFADATTGGRKPNTGKAYEPVLDISSASAFSAEYDKHRGNFDDHIATSIPGFREVQQAVGNAIAKTLANGGSVLDIGASEGSFIKAISAVSGGKVETVGLDPNPAMAKFFAEHSSVPGSTYAMEAFSAKADEGAVAWTEDDGTEIRNYAPGGKKFDVVHEAMTLQFISNAREAQVARVKEMMKETRGAELGTTI